MSPIFMISDLGYASLSLGRIKGLILNDWPGASFVDVNHEIKNWDTAHGAYVLRNLISTLPERAIIITYVDCYYDDPAEYIAVKAEKRTYLGPDNGIISMALGNKVNKVYNIGNSEYGVWPGKLISQAAAKAGMGFPGSDLGDEYPDYERRFPLNPIINKDLIRATIIAIDRYGNLILNLDKEAFEKQRNNRRFSLHFQHDGPITFISNQYSEVEVGEVLARFNSTGLMEIAVNHSHAVDELNLNINDLIQIDFY